MTASEIEYKPLYQAYDLFVPSKDEDTTLPPVVLLHGMTSSRKTWLDIPQTIADATKRKVYTLDARNHGESEWSEKFDYDILARDVEQFMWEANISKAVLVGHSMGGKTAMVFSFTWPEKVDKLVLEDISPKVLPSLHKQFGYFYMKALRESLSELPEGCDLEKAKEVVAQYLGSCTPQEHCSKKKSKNTWKTLPLKMSEKGITWQANMNVIENAYINSSKFSTAVDGIYNGETLFICGSNSLYDVYGDKDEILQQFPNAIFSVIDDATHLVHLEFPEIFSAQVVEFVGAK